MLGSLHQILISMQMNAGFFQLVSNFVETAVHYFHVVAYFFTYGSQLFCGG